MFLKIDLKACNVFKTTLQDRRFPVNITKFLRKFFTEDFCKYADLIYPLQVPSLECLAMPYYTFFNWYLTAPRSTLGHCRGDSLTNPMLITMFDS